jgi:hypothetical protein
MYRPDDRSEKPGTSANRNGARYTGLNDVSITST